MSGLLLLSGGMDSALCLKRYGAALAVGFDYGQSHWIELDYAERLAAEFKTEFVRHTLPPLPRIDDVVFAGRNAVLLAHGAAIAQARGLDTVTIGCNLTDAERFPDCRGEFLWTIGRMLRLAYGVSVHAPLLTTPKRQIKAECADLETWSCYAPRDGKPCGECLACRIVGGEE